MDRGYAVMVSSVAARDHMHRRTGGLFVGELLFLSGRRLFTYNCAPLDRCYILYMCRGNFTREGRRINRSTPRAVTDLSLQNNRLLGGEG